MNKTKKITFIALLSALAVVFTLYEISYPFVPWLKFDISELVILFATSLLGLIPAVIIGFIKTGMQLFTGDATPYNIGEITALIASLSFAISFYFTKNLNLILRLVIVSVVFTTVMVLLNFFISTPVYFAQSFDYKEVINMGVEMEVFNTTIKVTDTASYLKLILLMYVPFNLVKASVISIIYILTEKPIQKAFDLILNK